MPLHWLSLHVGEQAGNFADFTTTSGIMRVGGNKKDVFTRDRQPKAAPPIRVLWVRHHHDRRRHQPRHQSRPGLARPIIFMITSSGI